MKNFMVFCRPFLAVIGGLVVAFIVNVLLANGYAKVNQDDLSWTGLVWGKHLIGSVVFNLTPILISGFLAGLTQRAGGRYAAFMVSFIIFLVNLLIVGGILYDFLFSESRGNNVSGSYFLGNAIILVGTIPIGIYGGLIGEEFGVRYQDHFDSRPLSVFGVHIIHWFWVAPMLAFLGPFVGIWMKDIQGWLEAFERSDSSFHDGMGIGVMIQIFFIIGYLGVPSLLSHSLHNAYLILAGLHDEHHSVKSAVRFGCLGPVAAWLLIGVLEISTLLLSKITASW